MAGFIEFETDKGESLWINIDQVLTMKEGKTNESTVIALPNKEVTVKAALDDIFHHLDLAEEETFIETADEEVGSGGDTLRG